MCFLFGNMNSTDPITPSDSPSLVRGLHLTIRIFNDNERMTDTQYYVTDPDFSHIPVKELLSKVAFS